MPRISRVRFVNVGHDKTWADDLTLDFGTPRGPGHGVVWLENGGGKTTLLALIFATFLPAKRDFLLAHKGGRIAELLARGSTSQVLIEVEDEGGRALIGAFYQTPGGPAAGAAGDMRRLWFYARTSRHITLEGLPLRRAHGDRERRTTLEEFRQQLRTWLEGGEDLTYAEGQEVWGRALEERGVFQQLVRFQMLMSRIEGSVEDGLKFGSAAELIDLLADVLAEPESLAKLSACITELRGELRQYHDRTAPRAAFARNVLPPLRQYAALAEVLDQRERAATEKCREGHALAAFVRHRQGELRRAHEDAARDAALAGEHQRAEEHAATTATSRAHRIEYALAAGRLNAVGEELERGRVVQGALEREETLATLLERLHDLRALEAERTALTAALGAARDEDDPVQRRLDATRLELAAALLLRARAAEEELGTLRAEVEASRGDAREARDRKDAAEQALSDARAEHRSLHRQLDRARQELAGLERDGLLHPGETLELARDRLEEALADATGRRLTADARRAEHAALAAGARSREMELDAHRLRLRHEGAEVDRRVEDALAARRAVTGHPLCEALTGLTTFGPALEPLLRRRSAELERALLRLRAEEQRLEHLDAEVRAHGLLPPGEDVGHVLAHLALPQVHSGYVAHRTLTPGRSPTPELARLVVIPDADAGQLAAALARSPGAVTPFEGVRVVTVSEFTAWPDLPGTILAPANAGHVDLGAASAAHADLRRRLEVVRGQLGGTGEQLEAARRLAVQVDHALHLASDETLAAWHGQQATLREQLGTAGNDLAAARDERQVAELAVRGADASRTEAEQAETKVRGHLSVVQSHLALLDLTALGARVSELPGVIRGAEESLGQARAELDRAEAGVADAERRLDARRKAAADNRERADNVLEGAPRPEPAESARDLEEVRAEFTHLRQRLAGSGVGALQVQLDRALDNLGRRQDEFARRAQNLTRADVEAFEALHRGREPIDVQEEVSERLRKVRNTVTALTGEVAGQKRELDNLIRLHGVDSTRGDLPAAELTRKRMDEWLATATAARARAAACAEKVQAATQRAAAEQELLTVYKRAEDQLAPLPPLPEEAGPLVVADDAAVQTARGLMVDLSARQAAVQATERELGQAWIAWRAALGEADGGGLEHNVLTQLRAADQPTLRDSAASVALNLDTFVENAERELGQIHSNARDWSTIALEQTKNFVQGLRELSAASVIPESIEHLGGKRFLDLKPRPRLGEGALPEQAYGLTVQFAMQDGDLKPDVLLKRFAHDLFQFDVLLLNPNNGYHRAEYQSVEDLQRSASGGEGVAATLLLYCAIARARHRRSGKIFGGGDALLLDNPFARVTAPHLLRPVVEAATLSGVQLLPFTAVKDPNVLDLFPVRIRLRKNQWDPERNQHLLSGGRTLGAARVVRR